MDKLKFMHMNITFSLSSGLDLRDPKVRVKIQTFFRLVPRVLVRTPPNVGRALLFWTCPSVRPSSFVGTILT